MPTRRQAHNIELVKILDFCDQAVHSFYCDWSPTARLKETASQHVRLLSSFSPFLLSSRALCHWHTATILQLNGGDGDNDNFCMDGDGATVDDFDDDDDDELEF